MVLLRERDTMRLYGHLGRVARWFRAMPRQQVATTAAPEPQLPPGKSQFLPDSPYGEDRFGRSAFARRLSQALVLPAGNEGLVVGVEGTWGSGKTFVISQIKAVLAENADQPIVVEFNPWVVSGSDSLVEAMLEQLGSTIGEASASSDPQRKQAAVKAGSSVLRYLSLVRHLKYMKYAPGLTAVGNIAEDLASLAEKIGKGANESADDLDKLVKQMPEHSLGARRDAVVRALADLGRPIVVILDDLDRLPPEEIRSVFQAVKAVANFPRTAYLLSYDPTVAAAALDAADHTRGRAYLEKIVQVEYPLPEPLPWRMGAFVSSKLRDALRDTQRNLTGDEESRFREVASYVARLCRTPRDAIRISNRLRISLPATMSEVDACDVILLEALGICEQSIDRAIRRWPEDFTQTPPVEFESFGDEFYFAQAAERGDSDEKKKEHEWRRRIDGPMSVYAEGVLRHLFPEDDDRRGTLRVRNWDRLYRFLALGPSEHITELRALTDLIADENALQDALSADDRSALSILRAVELYCAELKIEDLGRLIESVSAFAAARLMKRGQEWPDLAKQYADVLEALLRRGAPKVRSQLLTRIVDTAPLSVSQALVTKVASDLGEWGSRAVLADDRLLDDKPEYERLVAKWITHVGAVFQSGVDLSSEPLIYAALYRLGQLGGDYGLARQIAKRLVEGGDLRRFMRSTQLSGEFEVTFGHLDVVWDREELLDHIQRHGKSQELYKKAINLLGSKEATEYFDGRTTKPTTKWPLEKGA